MYKVRMGHRPALDLIQRDYFEGVIHSRFRRVINILITYGKEENTVLSLVAGEAEKFPWSLLLPADTVELFQGAVGERVIGYGGNLYFDREVFDLSQGMAYDMILCPYAGTRELSNNVLEANALLDGMASLALAPTIQRCYQEKLVWCENMLKNGVRKKDHSLFKDGCQALLGLGPGLTPSGDDYLTGILTVIGLENSPLCEYKPYGKGLLAAALGRTNRLSYEYLKRAADGYIREKMGDFLTDLFYSDAIGPSLNRLLTVGASSGRDLAKGLLLGIELAEGEKMPGYSRTG